MSDKKPVTDPRVTVPEGENIEEVLSKLEVSIDDTEKAAGGINQNYCCVDVSVVGPFSTISVVEDSVTKKTD